MIKLRKEDPGWRVSISGRQKSECLRSAFEELGRRPSRRHPRNILIGDDLLGRHHRPGKQCEFSSKDTETLGGLGEMELCDLIVCKRLFEPLCRK